MPILPKLCQLFCFCGNFCNSSPLVYRALERGHQRGILSSPVSTKILSHAAMPLSSYELPWSPVLAYILACYRVITLQLTRHLKVCVYRYPGSCTSVSGFTEALRCSQDIQRIIAMGRWDADTLYSTGPEPDKIYARFAAALGGCVSEFDTQIFGMSVPEASSTDPQVMLLLLCGSLESSSGSYSQGGMTGGHSRVNKDLKRLCKSP